MKVASSRWQRHGRWDCARRIPEAMFCSCAHSTAVAFERAERDDGITYARVTQVPLDPMKGPGRGPPQAEAL
ncbi:MAG: hypothetical protein F4X72_14595 [Dehalococcoidia bacterium]|nr:hypothetical protein [Dehalococcoidia bacterium]